MRRLSLMLSYRYPLIAREGWLVLALLFMAMAIVHFFIGNGIALLMVGVLPIGFFLFRDPPCTPPSDPLGVLSPIAGRVVAIGDGFDEQLGCRVLRISIAQDFWSVRSLRSPIEGSVKSQRKDSRSGASEILIETDEGHGVRMSMNPSYPRRLSSTDLCIGARVGQGQRCGFLFRGGVELSLPANSNVEMIPGSKVVSGMNILATLSAQSQRP